MLQLLILSVFKELGSKIMSPFFSSFSNNSFVPVFLANPPTVLFSEYEVGQVYEVRTCFFGES